MKASQYSITGFVLSLVIVSMFASVFATLLSGLETEYGLTSNSTIAKYNQTADLVAKAEEIRDSTNIRQDQGILDVIGGFFSSGYSALKTVGTSFEIFTDFLDQAVEDIEVLGFFREYLYTIIIIALFVGVFVAALLKWVI